MRRVAKFILTILVVGAFIADLSCTSTTTDTPPAPPVAAAPQMPARKQYPRIAVQDLERRIHDCVNKERRKQGLPTMRWDNALGQIAGTHSRDMADKRYFSHTSPEGHDYSYRYLKSGYACGVTVNGILLKGAENIYRISPGTGEDPADAIIRGWLENKKDRSNLLSLPWDREGVGICIGPDGVLYVTMNFC
jgi:uncharacterized protein YkwD